MAEAEKVDSGVQPETGKKGKRGLFIILGAVILLGAGGFFVWRYLHNLKPVQAESRPMSEVKSVMNLDAFLVNLADVDSTRFVKVQFRLGLDEEKLGEEFAADPVVLAATRDKIISLLSTKAADEILSVEGKKRLREEIREKVNALLPRGKVVEVFIMDFVVQL